MVDKYYAWLDVSLVTFRNFDIIYGAVTNNNELLNYVNWDGMSNYTTGKYCFPLEPGAELMLSPISPGYRIEPATVYVSGTQRKAFASDFKARPLRIDEDIEIYYRLRAMRKMVRPIIISRYLGMSSLFRTLYGDRSLPWRIRPVWIYRPLRNFICGIMISLSAFG